MAKRRLKKAEATERRGAQPIVQKTKREWHMPRVRLPWRGIVICTLVVAFAFGFHKWINHWQIDRVHVGGEFNAWSPASIQKYANVVVGQGFLSADISALRERLQTLALIRTVTVKKQWPDQIHVHITEALPIAIWNDTHLLSNLGKVSDIPKGFNTDHLIHMSGAKYQTQLAVRYFTRLQKALSTHNILIKKLQVSAIGALDVELDNGWTVVLGRKHIGTRLQRLTQLINTLPQQRIERVDLRYSKGASVKFRAEQPSSQQENIS